MTQAEVYALIHAERCRQERKWAKPHAHGYGSCASEGVEPMVKVAVLVEEVGEVARALLDGSDVDVLRAELVQVAAVATAWLESL